MALNTKINWANHTVNLWWGCSKIHTGCKNCYAERLSYRLGNDVWGVDKPRRIVKNAFRDLDKIQKLAEKSNEIHRVFVGSMMDIFENSMTLVDIKGNKIIEYHDIELRTHHLRFDLFQSIVEGKYNNIMFLFLTKRPENINKYIPEIWKQSPPDNVMFGTSVVNQNTYNRYAPELLSVNGKRFLSIEPQLDDIILHSITSNDIHWIIQGGESGQHKRFFSLEWANSMWLQCSKLNIPYFFKQIDGMVEIPFEHDIKQYPHFFY